MNSTASDATSHELLSTGTSVTLRPDHVTYDGNMTTEDSTAWQNSTWNEDYNNTSETTENSTIIDYYDYSGPMVFPFFITHRNLAVYIVNAIIVFLGLAGNMLVIIVVMKYASLRKQATNVLILSQCVVDFISALILGLMLITEIIDIYGVEWVTLSDSNVLSHVWCAWWQSDDLVRAVFRVSTFNLIVITLERYLGICHPFVHIKHVTTNVVRASVALTWVLGIISVFSFSHWATRVHDNHCVWVMTMEQLRLEISIILIMQYCIPVPLFIIMYAMIIRKLTAKHKDNPGPDGSQQKYNDVMDAAKRNTIKMLVTVVVLYVICWTCLMADYILSVAFQHYNALFYDVAEIFTFINCCCNPFIYIWRSETYRAKMKGLFVKSAPSSMMSVSHTASTEIASSNRQ